jgi:uncharacterized protein
MSEAENQKIIEQIYEAFGRGDLPSILDALTDDVSWQHPRPMDIPWGGQRRGREEVVQFFAAIGENLQVEQFKPQKTIVQGETVIVLGHERMRVKSTSRVYETDWVHVWTLREGKVAGFREYTDTATVVEALR